MNRTQIVVLIAIVCFLTFRLYKKYVKKEKDKSGTPTKTASGSVISSPSKDDEYEPYSKR